MANVSAPLRVQPPLEHPEAAAPTATRRVRPAAPSRRRHVLGAAVAFVLLPIFLGPAAQAASTQAQPPTADQAQQRREEIRKQQAQIAADLQPLTATDEELNKAVQATAAQVRTSQAKVADAQRAADEAQQNADRLAAEQAKLQEQADQLKAKVRDRAVSAYVNPSGKVDQGAMLLETNDLTEAERKRELVELVTGNNDDAVDKLRAVRQSLEQTRVDQNNAANEARARKADLDGEVATLKASQEQQAKVKAMVDGRINGYKQEASQLQAEDANMQQVIQAAQIRYAAQLAAAAQQRAADAAAAAARAQQQQAAAPAQAPRSNGGGGGAPAAVTAAAPPANAPSRGGFQWPVAPRVSQEFGVNGHPGIDLVASIGTPIVAAASGVVISAGWNNGGYGNLVLIDNGGGVVTAYAHQSQIAVSQGQSVSGGQVIGYVGSTGNSTGPHLHFEVRVNGRTVNPRGYLP